MPSDSNYWNGIGGRAWVDLHALVDEVFAPLTDLLLDVRSIGSITSVLDVGCGAGGNARRRAPIRRALRRDRHLRSR